MDSTYSNWVAEMDLMMDDPTGIYEQFISGTTLSIDSCIPIIASEYTGIPNQYHENVLNEDYFRELNTNERFNYEISGDNKKTVILTHIFQESNKMNENDGWCLFGHINMKFPLCVSNIPNFMSLWKITCTLSGNDNDFFTDFSVPRNPDTFNGDSLTLSLGTSTHDNTSYYNGIDPYHEFWCGCTPPDDGYSGCENIVHSYKYEITDYIVPSGAAKLITTISPKNHSRNIYVNAHVDDALMVIIGGTETPLTNDLSDLVYINGGVKRYWSPGAVGEQHTYNYSNDCKLNTISGVIKGRLCSIPAHTTAKVYAVNTCDNSQLSFDGSIMICDSCQNYLPAPVIIPEELE